MIISKIVKINKLRLLLTFFFMMNIKITHTHFPSCVHLAQPLRLLLHCPALKKLLKKRRLCSVIHRLHVGCDWIVFGFDKLLQSPAN